MADDTCKSSYKCEEMPLSETDEEDLGYLINCYPNNDYSSCSYYIEFDEFVY